MRLSEIKGEAAFETLAAIIPPITDMACDAKVTEMFSGKRVDGESNKDYVLRVVKGSVPYLLRNYKDGLITILAALDGRARGEFEATFSVLTLPRLLFEIFNDPEIATLFTSAGAGAASASSASAATKDMT